MTDAGIAWYHVHLGKGLLRQADQFNLTEQDVIERVVRPWLEGKQVMIGGKAFLPNEAKLTIYAGQRLTTSQIGMGQGWSNAIKFGEDVTAELLASARGAGTRAHPAIAGKSPDTMTLMRPVVFVSHASADKVIVDPFVDTILRLGCGLKAEQIFYSSGEDTGVPSGLDMIHHVREQVGEPILVVAIISPTFQTRPVCVAELGAAWGRSGDLFPLAVPGMARTDMEGVLEGMTVRYLNDGAVLDELRDRITELTGGTSSTATWDRYKEQWRRAVDELAAKVPTPTLVTAEELEQTQRDRDGAREALAAAEAEVSALKQRIAEYHAATTAEERKEALLPKNEKERFDALRQAAESALFMFGGIVREAIYRYLADGGMPSPNAYEDQSSHDAAAEAVRRGDLRRDSDGNLVPDEEVELIADAVAAVDALQEMLRHCSDDFETWFRAKYGAPPDLRRRQIWDAIVR